MAESPDPPIEVLTSGDDASTGMTHARKHVSRKWLLVVGVLALAALFLVVTSGDDRAAEDPAANDRTPSTSQQSSGPDSAAPGPTTTTPDLAPVDPVTVDPGRAGPLLGRSVDAMLLLGGGESGWWVVDLTDNSARPAPVLDDVPASAITPVRDGVALINPVDAVPFVFPLTGAAGSGSPAPPRRLDTGTHGDVVTGPAVLVLAGDGPDQVWVLHGSRRGSSAGLQATLVGIDGVVLAGPIDVPGTPVAATSRSIVFDAAGRTFLASVDGIDAVGVGTTYDAAGGVVARVVCDEEAQCAESIHSLGTGAAAAGSSIPSQVVSDERITMVLSAQGGLVTVSGFVPDLVLGFTPAATLRVTPPGGEPADIDVPSIRAAPAWLPDGESLVVLTNIGLHHVSIEDGRWTGRRLEGIDVGDATSVFVIPRAEAQVPTD